MRSIAEFLFGRRATPLRWLAAVPGLAALLFVGHAFEDAGLVAGLPFVAIIAASVTYIVRPMVVLWIPLFGLFAFFAGAVAAHPDDGPTGEWIIFLLIGAVPALLMLLAWPRKVRPTSEMPAESVERSSPGD